jgi:Ribosomal protein L13
VRETAGVTEPVGRETLGRTLCELALVPVALLVHPDGSGVSADEAFADVTPVVAVLQLRWTSERERAGGRQCQGYTRGRRHTTGTRSERTSAMMSGRSSNASGRGAHEGCHVGMSPPLWVRSPERVKAAGRHFATMEKVRRGMSSAAWSSLSPVSDRSPAEQVVVIDCRAHMLGRLASIVAKELLSGQHVVRRRTTWRAAVRGGSVSCFPCCSSGAARSAAESLLLPVLYSGRERPDGSSWAGGLVPSACRAVGC